MTRRRHLLSATAATLLLSASASAQDAATQQAAITGWLDQFAASVPGAVTYDAVEGNTVTNLRIAEDGALLIGTLRLEEMTLGENNAPTHVGRVVAQQVSFGSREAIIYVDRLSLHGLAVDRFVSAAPNGALMPNLSLAPEDLLAGGWLQAVDIEDVQISSWQGSEAFRLLVESVSLSADQDRFLSMSVAGAALNFASRYEPTVQVEVGSFEVTNVDLVPAVSMMAGIAPPPFEGTYPTDTAFSIQDVELRMAVMSEAYDEVFRPTGTSVSMLEAGLDSLVMSGTREGQTLEATASMDLEGLFVSFPHASWTQGNPELVQMARMLVGGGDEPLELHAAGKMRAEISQETQSIDISEFSFTVEDMGRMDFTSRFVVPNAGVWEGMNDPATASDPQFGMAVASNMAIQRVSVTLEDLGLADRLALFGPAQLGLAELLGDFGRSMEREAQARLHALVAQLARFWADPGRITMTVTSKADTGLSLAFLPMMGPERVLDAITIDIEVE